MCSSCRDVIRTCILLYAGIIYVVAMHECVRDLEIERVCLYFDRTNVDIIQNMHPFAGWPASYIRRHVGFRVYVHVDAE